MCMCAWVRTVYIRVPVYTHVINTHARTHRHINVHTRQNRWVGSCALSQYNMLFVSFVSLYRGEWLTVHFHNDGTNMLHGSLASASISPSIPCSRIPFDFHHFLVFDRTGAANLYTSKTVPSFWMDKTHKRRLNTSPPSIYLSLHIHTSSYSHRLEYIGYFTIVFVSSIRRQNSLFPSLYNICLTRTDICVCR